MLFKFEESKKFGKLPGKMALSVVVVVAAVVEGLLPDHHFDRLFPPKVFLSVREGSSSVIPAEGLELKKLRRPDSGLAAFKPRLVLLLEATLGSDDDNNAFDLREPPTPLLLAISPVIPAEYLFSPLFKFEE